MLNIHMESLKKSSKDFFNITKMQIVLYNEKREYLHSYPEYMCHFCNEIRKNRNLAKECLRCDEKGFDICDRTKEKYIYTCHMGLTEAISPILENGIIIGYMMLGQVLETENKAILTEKITSLAKDKELDLKTLYNEIENMKIVSRETIVSAADMMEMCACYLWLKQIIKVNSYSLGQHLSKYIEENMDNDLSVKTLCKYLNISKSTLYKLSLSTFNMGISEYIRERRLALAKNLLMDKSLSITDVALKSGIGDANYFTKVFKKQFNLTPKEFKKSVI